MQVIAGMIGFLGLLGLCVSVLYVLWALLNVIRRKGKAEIVKLLKHAGYTFLASCIGLAIMLIMADPDSKTDLKDQKQQVAQKQETKEPAKKNEEKNTASSGIKIDLNEQKPQAVPAPAPQKPVEKDHEKSTAKINPEEQKQVQEPAANEQPKKKGVKKLSSDNPAPEIKSLGMSPEEFRYEFNSIIGQLDGHYRIRYINVDTGEVNDAFKYIFTEDLAMVGVVNKSDASLRDIMITASGTESVKNSFIASAVMLSSCQILNKSVDKKTSDKKVTEVLDEAAKNKRPGRTATRRVGDFEYSAAVISPGIITFGISKL